MSQVCDECRADVPDGAMICPSCGMPMKSALDKMAFAREWQAFVSGEAMLRARLRNRNAYTVAEYDRLLDNLGRVQVAWKKLVVRICEAGLRVSDVESMQGDVKTLPTPPPRKKKGKKTVSHGSTLVGDATKMVKFLDGGIKIHPDKYHIWFSNVGWYEVGPNCAWRVLDRILACSLNRPEYQKAPFKFSFSRKDGIALGKAIAVERGYNETWTRKEKWVPLATAVLDKNPECESGKKLTTAAFKKEVYGIQ